MNEEKINIKLPKTNYIVLTTHLDNLELARYIEKIPDTYFATFPYIEHYKQLQQENKQLKDKLEVPENCTLKTLDDYKDYYQDTTKEHILNDTYIDYCAYVNLAKRYSNLQQENKELKERIDKAIKYTRNANLADWYVTKDQYDEAFAYEMLHIREILKKNSNE